MIFGDSEAELYVNIGFYMAAILKPQDGCHDIIRGGGSYQKYKPKTMRSLWKKFDAFVQNIHIQLVSYLTTCYSAVSALLMNPLPDHSNYSPL